MSGSAGGLGVAFAAVGRQVRATPLLVAFLGIAAILGTIPGIAVPLLIRLFLDEYLVAGGSEWVVPIIVSLALASLVTGVLVWLEYRVLVHLSVRLSAASATRFSWHALRVSSQDVQAVGTGGLVARAAGQQRQAVTGGLYVPMSFIKGLSVVVFAVALLMLDLTLGLAALVVVAGSMAVTLVLLRRRTALQDASDRDHIALAVQTTAVVSDIETIKASANEPWVFDRWMQTRSTVGESTSQLSADGQRIAMVSPLTQVVGLGVVLALGAWLIVSGDLTLGTLIASQSLLMSILIWTGQLVYAGVLLKSVASTQQQWLEVRDLPLDPEVVPSASPRTVDLSSTTGSGAASLALRDVVFGYDRSQSPLLQGIDLDVPAGSWVALVGGSGSGKSTIARLAVGELQPWSGVVELGDAPRLELARADRAALLGYVPQYPVLMPGTIADNVTLFDTTVGQERITRALDDACILEAVMARPRGLLEEIGPSGHGFSGGELQRLALARALVRDPGVLVLDEATSALDPLVEAELVERLRRRTCTCLLVAHRLSSVRDADRIVVLDGGRVVQQGSFDDVRREGRFAELIHG